MTWNQKQLYHYTFKSKTHACQDLYDKNQPISLCGTDVKGGVKRGKFLTCDVCIAYLKDWDGRERTIKEYNSTIPTKGPKGPAL